MFASLYHLWQHHRILLTAFVIAVATMIYFAVTTLAATIYWMDPAHQDQRLAGWMTPRYVALSYQLPPDVLREALMFTREETPRRISLEALATETGMSLEDMQIAVDSMAASFREQQAND